MLFRSECACYSALFAVSAGVIVGLVDLGEIDDREIALPAIILVHLSYDEPR